ncbi:MAG: DUF1573 domain-containing protein [Chitinophagales bacterium]
MKKIAYIFIFICFGTLFFFQCKHKEEPKVEVQKFNHDSILANDKTIKKADSVAKVFKEDDAEDAKNATSIKFDKEVYDFGTCTEGDKVKKVIEFTNTGKLPLTIKQAFGSCGCTVPKFDKEPVAPGKKGKIEVNFDSTHKPGANTKSVMIEANTIPAITTITFSIKVNTTNKKKGLLDRFMN